jgi:hypothetical protein
MKYGIAGVVIGLILFIISPWLAIAVIAAAVAIPAVGAPRRLTAPGQRGG